MALKITVHSTGTGICALTSKEAEGLTVSFEDGTVSDAFLSWRGFRQLVNLKSGTPKPKAPAPKTDGQPAGKGGER
jgi:hypothetical protein